MQKTKGKQTKGILFLNMCNVTLDTDMTTVLMWQTFPIKIINKKA